MDTLNRLLMFAFSMLLTDIIPTLNVDTYNVITKFQNKYVLMNIVFIPSFLVTPVN